MNRQAISVDEFLQRCASDPELSGHLDAIKTAVEETLHCNNDLSGPASLFNAPQSEFEREWRRNYAYLHQHEHELAEQYPGQYIAVLSGRVYAVGDSPGELAGSILKELGDVPLVVDKPGKLEPEQLDLPLS